MRVILRIDGWTKFIDVSERIGASSRIKIPGLHDFFAGIRPQTKSMKDFRLTIFTFAYTGVSANGIRIFEIMG